MFRVDDPCRGRAFAFAIVLSVVALAGCGSSGGAGDVDGGGVLDGGGVVDGGGVDGGVDASVGDCGDGFVDPGEDCDGTDDCRNCVQLNDEDSDSIADVDEGRASLTDTDGDSTADYLDPDSDGDGIDDSVEAGDSILSSEPVDTDMDGVPDFRDGDSDDDGLPDANEFDCPMLGLHGRLLADTDGDLDLDLVEIAMGSNPCDAANRPSGVYFLLPFGDPEQTIQLEFEPRLPMADVFFGLDSTGSMGGELANLQSGITSIMSSVDAVVSDVGYGAGTYQDFPVNPFGDPASGDLPFELHQGITTDNSAVQSAIAAVSLRNGWDLPESGYEALFQIADGGGVSGAGGTFGPWTTMGRIGGAQFRPGSFPMVVQVTDAVSHDATCPAMIEAVTVTPDYPAGYNDHSKAQAISALQAIGARVITIQSTSTLTPDLFAKTETQLSEISESTGAAVPVCAFQLDMSNWRCGFETCCDGTIRSGNDCILRYAIPDDGSGLGDAVVDGITGLLKYSTLDVYAEARDDGMATPFDTSLVITRVEANSPDDSFKPPVEPERTCTPVPVPASFGGAGYDNGFTGFAVGSSDILQTGAKLYFTLAVQNTILAEESWVQAFETFVDIVDDATGTLLATQRIHVIVPADL